MAETFGRHSGALPWSVDKEGESEARGGNGWERPVDGLSAPPNRPVMVISVSGMIALHSIQCKEQLWILQQG